ncbi:hypothetical protein GCM10020000_39290 [Streptomyces olivoverticillatus]
MFQLDQPGEVLGGVAAVEAGQMALALGGFGGFVVEPDGRAEAARGRGPGSGPSVAVAGADSRGRA